MTELADLIDRAVALPPGPDLSAVLAVLPWEKVPNARLVEVLQARSRQLSHEQAECYAGMVEISHAVAVEELTGDRTEAVARTEAQFEWAAHEIAAGLALTPAKADRELAFGAALCERLPLVFAALQQGCIDVGRARVLVEYLDPANGDVTEEQARRLCERFVPLATGLTTKQLADRLYRALLAIDPRLRRRRYERAVQGRGVAVYLDPRTGTATLVGDGLPADEAAAAAARIDRMAAAARRAGHPGRLGQISSDLFLKMLNGEFHGLTEAKIIDRLLAIRRSEDDSGSEGDPGAEGDAAGKADDTDDDTDDPHDTGPDPASADNAASGPGRAGASPAAAGGDRWAGERMATRQGIEIRVGLGTLAGVDERPGEIPGLGPVGAHVARGVAARQRRGARWLFAIVDPRGYLLLAGPLRRRPRADAQAREVRGGTVEVHLTLEELQRYGADPEMSGWHAVLAEVARAWRDRAERRQRLVARPSARFARGPLADHVRVRDRNCVGPGCTRPARRSDLDHTLEHGRGGQTVQANIGPACARHHADKDRGWTLSQPEPGSFRWLSPLGRPYRTRGEPVRPELPDPEPTEHQDEDVVAEIDQLRCRYDPRILERTVTDSSRPPPPKPDPSPGDDPPPF